MADQSRTVRVETDHSSEIETVPLDDARRAVADRRWRDAFENLNRIDQAEALSAEDLELLATAAFLCGSQEDCRQARLRAYQIRVGTGDHRRAARLALRIGFEALDSGDVAEATGCLPISLSSCSAWVSQASALLGKEEECAERGWLLIPPAYEQLATRGNPEEAADGARQAMDVGHQCGDAELRALAATVHGRALVRLGGDASGIDFLDEAVSLVIADEVSPPIAGIVLTSSVDIAEESFDFQRWDRWVETLARWCDQQQGMVAFQARSLAHRAKLSRLHGRWTEAIELAMGAVEHPIADADPQAAAAALYEQGEVLRLRGEFTAAESAFGEVARLGRDPQPGMALLRQARGDAHGASASIARALAESFDGFQRVRLLPSQVEILLAIDDLAAASSAALELAGIADSHHSPILEATAQQILGRLALADGDAVDALVTLRQACRVWRHFDLPYQEAHTRLLMARACRTLDDNDTASLEFEAARRIFTRLGAEPDLLAIDDIPSEPRHGLTKRELEVLRQLATGMTNRAIADQLMVSPRTIDTHVTTIFAKLGVSNRSSATAYAHRQHLV